MLNSNLCFRLKNSNLLLKSLFFKKASCFKILKTQRTYIRRFDFKFITDDNQPIFFVIN